jgi:hypothetical protein
MANRKISDLTALTAPATGDLLPIVDISEAAAADKNKKITYGELLASAPDGSAAAPSFSFDSDPNTGIYNPGADQVAISTNGTGALFVDAFGRVGIGAVSTGARFDIRGGSGPYMYIVDSGANGGAFVAEATNSIVNVGSTYIGTSAVPLALVTGNTERLRITTAGNVGIGTTSPAQALSVAGNITADGSAASQYVSSSKTGVTSTYLMTDANGGNIQVDGAWPIRFTTNSSERARIDSSGRLLVGTSSARVNYYNSAAIGSNFQVVGSSHAESSIILHNQAANTQGAYFHIGKSRGTAYQVVSDNDPLGVITFQGADGSTMREGATIAAFVDGAPGASDLPTRLVFSTTADGASSPTERMRITNSGSLRIGQSTTDGPGISGDNTVGTAIGNNGYVAASRDGNVALYVNRKTNDGDLVLFYQDATQEGTISVSGTTVSYNGAHLSRWSQLPGGATREEILRGTVLSNIDEMCGWDEEENEQLNRMKVSDIEGDKNVSGVFQAWDDDDDTYTDDFYCAMTGDFIIRIAEGVTVERGDLLMSAGDGTAKSQDDDIIRSKTVAKVTSTHVTCTYEDGSYCVPCVLMTC